MRKETKIVYYVLPEEMSDDWLCRFPTFEKFIQVVQQQLAAIAFAFYLTRMTSFRANSQGEGREGSYGQRLGKTGRGEG